MPNLTNQNMPTSGFSVNKKLIFGLTLIIVIVLILAGAWYYFDYSKSKTEEPIAGEENLTALIEQVGRHIVLDEEEAPMIATIQDADALAEQQAFYSGARDGDKLLIYPTRAIIYDPIRDILVNVGPIQLLDQPQISEEETEEEEETIEEEPSLPTPPVPLTIDIRNGSGITGVAGQLSNQLSANSAYSVVNVTNASNANYTQTVIVNLKGYDLSSLEQDVGATSVSEMPAGESPSNADVLIIIGQ